MDQLLIQWGSGMQFIDLGAQRARIQDKLEKALGKVLNEGRYILGPEVAEFEQKLADYIGVKHVVACGNGTDALLIPLMANNIGPGDAVFCPSFTFAATAEVVALAGATPVFVDIDPDTYNIDIESLETAISEVRREGLLQPRGIIPVDLFGQPALYDQLNVIAVREGLIIIEDAAQAIGGRLDNTMCGAFGAVASTSFYPAKPLGCYGDGGAMFTNDGELAEILRSIAFHGKGESQYDNVRIGLNSRLDTMQAAVLLAKLEILPEEMDLRDAVATRYNNLLGDVVKVPVLADNVRSAWAQYAIETPHRDRVRAALQKEGIPSVIYYEKPLHLQQAYAAFPRVQSGLPVSETLPERILCLPMHPYLTAEDQERVAGIIRSAVKG